MYKTYQIKIKDCENPYFQSLFLEAKWFYNTILATEDVFKFDTKQKFAFLDKQNNIQKPLTILSSQMKQEIKDRIIESIKGLSVKKSHNFKVGRLKFKKFINSIPLKNQTFKLGNNTVRFQGFKKKFKVSGLEQLPEDITIKSGTLVRNALGIYLHITGEIQDAVVSNKERQIVGLDFGIKDSFSFSDGTKINTDFSDIENLIKKAAKSFSRKKRGSINSKKARKYLAKLYQRLENQKKDISNKLLNKLNSFKVCFQDEMISNWQKGLFGRKVHKGILGRIKEGLRSNPENLMISRKEPTTKLCLNCGCLNIMSLDKRIYSCECGYSKDRDIHSANNMIFIGLGQTYVEMKTSVFEMCKQIESKFLSVKQEANML